MKLNGFNQESKGGIFMDDNYKEVRFDQYCQKCKHYNKNEDEEPCDECLNNPVNLYSHKPINFEEKEK